MITNTKIFSRIEITYVALGLISILFAIALFITPLKKVHALPSGDTFIVTNTNDSGVGSLRQAITDANGNGNPGEQDIIEFNIAGAGDQTITPITTLSITEPVLINGFTQGDANANTSIAPNPLDSTLRIAIKLGTSGQIEVSANDVTLQGLVINDSPDNAVIVNNASRFKLSGSYTNVATNGMATSIQSSFADPDSTGGIVLIDSPDAQIGGNLPEERSVLGVCTGSCVSAEGSSTNLRIQGTYIGIGADGHTDISGHANVIGVFLKAGANNAVIGGTNEGDTNIIAHLQTFGLLARDVANLTVQSTQFLEQQGANVMLQGVSGGLFGSDDTSGRNVVSGNAGQGGNYAGFTIEDSPDTATPTTNYFVKNNYFGVTADGETQFSNEKGNIRVRGSSNHILIENNKIWYANTNSGARGIVVAENAQGVAIVSNSIYHSANLGIDLGENGITLNDLNDIDSGPNGYLNTLENLIFEENEGSTNLSYRLDVPTGEYRIEFFSNTAAHSSGSGEGETLIGHHIINHDGSGKQTFNTTIAGIDHPNISATVTQVDNASPTGYGPTSEFSFIGTEQQPIVDTGAKIKLINPQDVALGATLYYDLSIINYGDTPFDISGLSNSNPGLNSLFQFVIPPDITFTGNSDPNVTCFSYGPNSAAFTGVMNDHADHELGMCGFSGGSHILQPGESYTTTISVLVDNSSDLVFTAFAMTAMLATDPEADYMTAILSSGNDILTTLLEYWTYAPNNLAIAVYPIEDINITKSILNQPDNLAVGDTLTYEFSLQNDGITPFDLSNYDMGFQNPLMSTLLLDILPPGLSYIGTSDPDLSCNWMGESTAPMADPQFASHQDYALLMCNYGSSQILGAGEVKSFTIDVEVTQEQTEPFTNYVIGPGAANPNDPDHLDLNRSFTNSFAAIPGSDTLDNLLKYPNGSFSFATFTAADDPGDNGGNNGSGGNNGNNGNGNTGGNNDSSNNDELANTGITNVGLITLAIILIGTFIVSSALYVQRYSKTTN